MSRGHWAGEDLGSQDGLMVRCGVLRVLATAGMLLVLGLALGTWAPRADALTPGLGEGPGFCATVPPSGDPSGYDLGAHYADVWACGPIPGSGEPGYGDAFEESLYGFQCTELADRFLWDAWGKEPVFGSDLDGEGFAAAVHSAYPSVPLVANGTAGQPYVPGDIVSFSGDGEGHVAVVTASTENAKGAGKVTIMEENAAANVAPAGEETLTVSGWSLEKNPEALVTPLDFDALASPSAPAPTVTDVEASPPSLGSAGGQVTVSAHVQHGSTCVLSASPALAGLPTTVPCTDEDFSLAVSVPANSSSKFAKYKLTLTADHWSVGKVKAVKAKPVTVSVAEHGGSGGWTTEALAIPAGADREAVGLWSVSCTATTACTAVGEYADEPEGPGKPLAEFWDGSAWSVQEVQASSASSLHGVSCTSASACVAVGSLSGGGPVSEIWNGSTWTDQGMPDPDDETSIYSVACASASSCEAVGVESTGINVPVAEHWDGSSWSVQSAVDPHPPGEPGGENSGLYGITCTSASACIAVGEQELFSQEQEDPALAEKWNGTAWSLMPLPRQHAFQYWFNAVSCSSANDCLAVGHIVHGDYECTGALAEHWNGKAWASTTWPNECQEVNLQGVSCASAKECIAVGGERGSEVGYWDGKSWTAERSPWEDERGVSCVSATYCMSVRLSAPDSSLYQ